MKKIGLLGSVGTAALLVASATANAADVMPIVVPVITPAVVPPPGPVKVVQIDTTLTAFVPGPIFLFSSGAVDVQTASGWGFQLLTDNSLLLGASGFLSVEGRVYRAVGDATVGVFATTGLAYGPGIAFSGFSVGFDADYYTDTAELYYAIGANFSGGFDDLQSIFYGNVERGNFRIEAVSLVETVPFSGFGGVSLGYAIGPLTPYAFLGAGFGPGFAAVAGVGLDFEHDVGDRLTLTASSVLVIGSGMSGIFWSADAGFEYALGAVGDGPLTIHGNIGTGTGGGFSAEIGIGLKFGDGRVTGLGGLLQADLPNWFGY